MSQFGLTEKICQFQDFQPITVYEKLKFMGKMEKNKAKRTQVALKIVLKVKDPVFRPTNLRNVQLANFFRLYFCCLLDQDLKGQCRQKNWAVFCWFLLCFKEKENCTVLNDKITIIVNLQYRKGFLYWCWKEKEWKYYFILSHLM